MHFSLALGTTSLASLRSALDQEDVRYNSYAEELLNSWVSIAPEPCMLRVEVVQLASLGLVNGGTMQAIIEVAGAQGLAACPLEAALHLRLQWKDQPATNRVTLVSERPTPEELQPRGFYLRRDDEGLWLRGYVATDDWVFAPDEAIALVAG